MGERHSPTKRGDSRRVAQGREEEAIMMRLLMSVVTVSLVMAATVAASAGAALADVEGSLGCEVVGETPKLVCY